MRSSSLAYLAVLAAATSSCASPGPQATAPRTSIAVPEVAPARTPAAEPSDQEASSGDVAAFGDTYPAGLCGYSPYLSSVCGDVPPPRHAVVLDEILYFTDASSPRAAHLFAVAKPPPEHFFQVAERALASAQSLDLAPGFPFVVTYDELPAADPERRGGAVVAGLFASEAGARRLMEQKKLPGARVVELATPEVIAARHEAARQRLGARPAKLAVQIALATPAYDEADVARLEESLGNQVHGSYADLLAARAAGLGALTPRCDLQPGRLFSVDGSIVDRYARAFAPVQCGKKRAWVPWSATRLDSVVTVSPAGPRFHQIVLVECDVPTLASRAWSSSVAVLPAQVGCPG